MIYLKKEDEIELIRQSCILVCKTLAEVANLLKIGVTGKVLDRRAEEFIRDHQGVPGFKGYNHFPSTLCISLNEAVVHGIPNDIPFQSGDIVSIDCGVLMNEFYGDAAYTFALGEVPEEKIKLLKVTEESLYLGIGKAIAGNRVGDIGHAIQNHTEVKHHYGVVKELVGHGLGRKLHESPDVPNYGKAGNGILLKEGMVIAIEPMINLGTRRVKQLKDGWTVVTVDRKVSAHFEHSIAIRKNQADILSDHSFIKTSMKNNEDLLKY